MKIRTVFIALLCFLFQATAWGQKIKQEGITYEVTSQTTVSVVDCDTKKEGTVVVPSVVASNGMKYTVTEVGLKAFENCKKITFLTLPNSIEEIGASAFWNCKALKELKVPDECVIGKSWNSNSPFLNCNNLMTISGYKILAPQWIVEHIDNVNSAFLSLKTKRRLKNYLEKGTIILDEGFRVYAQQVVEQRMVEWQKKSEFETTPQYLARMSDDNRKKKMQELINEAKNEYIKVNTPDKLSYRLAIYKADAGVFPVVSSIRGLDTLFVKVPLSDAPQFKADWENVKIEPTFGVVNDMFNWVSCQAIWNGKVYASTTEYVSDASSDLVINLPPLEIELDEEETAVKESAVDNSIDIDIPKTSGKNSQTFAFIIGNETYQYASKVDYAQNDAKIFADYCRKTLGIPNKNILYHENVTYGSLLAAIENMKGIARSFNGDINIIFYYAGHGIPDESTKDAYLLPVDANGRHMEACYSLNKLYKVLGEMNARQTTVFIDACFSGSNRGSGMLLSGRGVLIKPKPNSLSPTGKMVVFAATKEDETAHPYVEKRHGLFTYFLLKKLQETKGNCTLGELESYVRSRVSQESNVTNKRDQTPTLTFSASVRDSWKEWKLK